MSTTTAAAASGYRVQVPPALAAKAQYLTVLIAKIKNAAVNAVKNAIAGIRRLWNTIPAQTSARVFSIVMSTRAGYETLTGVIRSTLQFVTNNFQRIETAFHNALDKVGIFLSSIVARVHKPTGEKLGDLNSKFTDLRWNLITKVRSAFAGAGTLLYSAFNSDTTVRTTTGVATAVTVSMAVNGAFNGAVAGYAASVPAIGTALSAIVTGGIPAILAVIGAAVAGAAMFVFNATAKDKLVGLLKPAWRFVKGQSVVTFTDTDGSVVVENAATEKEATKIAVEHVQANIEEMEAVVRGHGRRI